MTSAVDIRNFTLMLSVDVSVRTGTEPLYNTIKTYSMKIFIYKMPNERNCSYQERKTNED